VNKLNQDDITDTNESLDQMTIFEHLKDLRVRLIYSIIIVTIGTIITFSFSSVIFNFLAKPYLAFFPPDSLIGTGPAEAFVLRIKVAFFSSIIITCPFLFHQLWLFVAPGLYESEQKMVLPFVAFTTILFLLGSGLCYLYILPITYSFFLSQYEIISVSPQIRISEHISLTLNLLISFGLCFEIPIITFFLARFRILTHHHLISWFRYAVVGCFVIGAILTPPDVVTQILFAVPLLILYIISIFVAKYSAPKE
jgi:sec-independent protein translocase protein TatC